MKAGKYTLKDLFVNRYLRQVIVPEIQRDYVWQAEQLQGFLTSLLGDFDRFAGYESNLQLADKELEESFNAYRKRRTCSASIGFIYAYHDEELAGRYFLIDGQQRITSAFLLLLTLAHRNRGLADRFRSTYLDEGLPKLDYKVRQAAHDFLFKLVPYLLDTPADRVEEQVWHYAASASDPTIQHLIANFNWLQDYFSGPVFQAVLARHDTSETAFFEYLEDYTEFYYFDTNISEQGEDLYIYMNARGEQVQSNENVKADLLSQLDTPQQKDEYGTKWEAWQDFFWQHRGRGKSKSPNPNADAGFNEFLACISGLTNLLSGSTSHFYSPDDHKAGGIKTSQLLSNLSLTSIEKYVNGLLFLEEHQAAFASRYASCGWVEDCLNELWDLFNSKKTNWYANYSDDDRGTERNRMAFLWPVLHFLFKRNELGILPINEAFRVLRIHYLHFTNFDRSVAHIAQEVEDLCQLGPFKIFGNSEENLKHALYLAVPPGQVYQYEELIWEIEDHKFNLDGSNVGSTNISHLISLLPTTSLAELQQVKDRFYELFPPEDKTYQTLQSVLLYYGPYHDRESPFYYFNFNFGNWRKTIRGLGSQEAGQPHKAFSRFFAEFLIFPGTLEHFLLAKRTVVLNPAEAHADYQKVLYYNQVIGNEMWRSGDYIAFSSGEYCGLPLWRKTDDDASFPGFRVLYNTRGDVRRKYQQALQGLLPAVAI